MSKKLPSTLDLDRNKMFRLFRLYNDVDKEIKEIFKKHEMDTEEVIFILSLLADEYMKKAGIDVDGS